MKTTKRGILTALASLLIITTHAFAVVEQTLQIQGTNLVLSWPSTGSEHYAIEYRPTLDPGTPWMWLTNNYPANSTNRTTLIIPCCVLSDLIGTNGGSFAGNQASSSSSAVDENSYNTVDPRLWARPKDGPGDAVPLSIYPPGFDTNTLFIFERDWPQSDWQSSGSGVNGSDSESNGAMNGLSSGGCNCPDMGFFRVWHIPDFPAGITNFTFDGPTFIPVNFKDYRERVARIEVLLNGNPTHYSEFLSLIYNGQTNWGMGIYFDRLPSGTYQIQLRSTLRLNDEIGDDTVYLVLSNLTRSITVDNQVTFTNWDNLILSTNYTFKAQTKNTDTDWSIDIYDAWNNYVNGGSGHTSNGQIAWTWDLTDVFANPRDDLDSDPFFVPLITFSTLNTNGTGGPQATRYTPAPAIQYPNHGAWIIAYLDRYYLESPLDWFDSQYQQTINTLYGGPALWNIPVIQFPLKFGTNYTQVERDNSWSDLYADLFTHRNFYYFGHGGSTQIGADSHTFDTNGDLISSVRPPGSQAFLESQKVKNGITYNNTIPGPRQYRFVFLDGCQTAAPGGDWPEAWGMNQATNDIGYYTNSDTNPNHFRPSAFVGWDVNIGGKGWGNVLSWWTFRLYWMGNWSANNGNDQDRLNDVLESARSGSNWIPFALFRQHIRVYGYPDLKFDEYNHKTDWQWPP